MLFLLMLRNIKQLIALYREIYVFTRLLYYFGLASYTSNEHIVSVEIIFKFLNLVFK